MPAIFAKFSHFLSEAIRSRLAWLLVFLHAAWFLLTIANMSPPSPRLANFIEQFGGSSTTAILAGRPFHYHYESLSLQIMFLVDLPSWLASAPIGFLFLPFFKLFHVGRFSGSYIGAGILLVMSSLQWLLLGNLLHVWLNSRRWGVATIQRLNRHFEVLTVLVLSFTAVTAPILNARSRLRFHDAGISFH
jgi:hypothetical protein